MISGVISNTGPAACGITKTGPGLLILTGENTFDGDTIISGGTLQVGNGGTTGRLPGNVINNATLAFSRSDDITFSGIVSGAGTLRQLGPARLTLTGENSYSGGTTIVSGTLQIGNGGTTGSIVGNVTNHGTLIFDRSNDLTFTGTISGTGELRKTGAGTLSLTGSDSLSGAIHVAGGTLAVPYDLYKDRAITVSGEGAMLSLPAPNKLYVGHLAAGTLEVADKGALVTNDACYLGYAGTGTATVSGSGSIWNSNSLFVGYGNGTLNITSGGRVNNATCIVGSQLGSTGTVLVDGPGSTLANQFNLDVGSGGTGTLNIARGGTVSSATGGVGTYVGGTGLAMVDGVDSTWANSGDLFVAAAYGYVGGTCGGTLNIVGGGSVNNTSGYVGHLSGATGVVTISGSGSTWTNRGFLFLGNGGTGSVTQTGGTVSVGETLLLGTQTTGRGAYRLNGGTLILKAIAQGEGTAEFNFGGGTLKADAAFASNLPMTLTGTNGNAQVDTAGYDLTLGPLSGPGGLNKAGAGTLTLGSPNTYTGGTTVSAGTLKGTAGGIQGNVHLAAASANVTFDQATEGAYGGIVSGSGGLTKIGDGTLKLWGANTYTGATTINEGSLKLGYTPTPTQVSVWLDAANTATLAVNADGSGGTPPLGGTVGWWASRSGSCRAMRGTGGPTYVTDPLSGKPVLHFTGSNPLAFNTPLAANGTTLFIMFRTDSQAYTQPVESSTSPSLHLSDGNAASHGNRCAVTSGGAMRIQGAAFPSASAWHVQAVQVRGGDWKLWVDNTLLGTSANATTIGPFVNIGGNMPGDIGELLLFSGNLSDEQRTQTCRYLTAKWMGGLDSDSIPDDSPVTIHAAGTLDLAYYNETIGPLSGAGLVRLDNARLTVNSVADSQFSGTISGAGDVTKIGNGTLTLSGGNAYDGDTLVQAGKLIMPGLDNSGSTTVGTGSSTAELITGHIRQDTLTIHAGGKVTIDASGSSATSVVNFLSIANGAGGFTWSAGGGGIAGDLDGAASVPEPAAWLLLLLGGVASAILHRRASHCSAASGNSALNFTPWRGSAIQSATVSRQRA